VGKAIDKATGKGVAAAVDILEETTRPLHAVAAAERRAIKNIKEGKNPANLNVLKAGYEGAANKRKDTYSDVLGDLGVKKGPVRSVGGFVGDVVGDPLNYVTLGTAGVARTAAKEAGEAAAKKAARKGMSKAGQETVRRAAAKRAAARAPKNRGLTIGTRKRKTSGKTTALLSRKSGITNIGKTIRERSGVQDAGAHMRPDFRQKGVPREAHERVQSAAAARRAQMASGSRKTEALGRAFKKKHGTKDNERILDAIETRQISKLPKELREPAIRLRSEFRHMNRVERQAGVRAAERKNYVAHVRRQDVEGGGSKFPRIGGGLGAAKRRKVEGSLAKIREESPDLFTEDIPSILAKRGGQSSRTVAIANFERELAKTGRALTPKSYASIGDEEAIYHLVGGSKIRKVYPVEEGKGQAVKELEAALAGRSKNGQYVIANEKLVDDAVAHEMVAPAKGWHRRYRKAHGTLKTLLTMPMPSYHMRNLYGDTANAWYEQSAPELAKSLAQSAKAFPEFHRMRKGEKTLALGGGKTKGTTLKIGEERVPIQGLLTEAEKHGGLNAGFSRDLMELLGEHPGKIGRLRNIGEMRENFVRFATYVGHRRKGLDASAAAKAVRDLHFDYGDLTATERAIRDIIPFYTFTARNTVLQAKKLVTRPGKVAVYQKAIEEAGKAAGLPEDWQKNLKDYQKLGVPLPAFGLESAGKKLLLLPGLPIMDLNRLSKDPREQFFLVAQMATGFKVLPELIANYSIFFRGPIDDDGRKVAAPDWMHAPLGVPLPAEVQEELGLEYVYDKSLDKKVWKYKAKWDYLLRQLPETSALFNLTSTGKNRRGQDKALKAISLTGVRPEPYDPLAARSDDLYERAAAITRKLKNLNRQGVTAANPTKQYKVLLAQQKATQERIERITTRRRKQGDAVAPIGGTRKKPPKKQADDRFDFGSSDSGGKYDF
jgi:hypothetical protein